jgi:hypothetical protein
VENPPRHSLLSLLRHRFSSAEHESVVTIRLSPRELKCKFFLLIDIADAVQKILQNGRK